MVSPFPNVWNCSWRAEHNSVPVTIVKWSNTLAMYQPSLWGSNCPLKKQNYMLNQYCTKVSGMSYSCIKDQVKVPTLLRASSIACPLLHLLKCKVQDRKCERHDWAKKVSNIMCRLDLCKEYFIPRIRNARQTPV